MSPLRALAFLTSSALFFNVVIGAGSPSANDVTTYHNDTARTGQTLPETVLTPATVTHRPPPRTRRGGGGAGAFSPRAGTGIARPLYLWAVAVPGLGTPNVVY